jgi:acetyl esterase
VSETKPVLEEAAQAVADANSKPPFLYELAPAEGRKVLDSVQDGDVAVPPADVEDLMIPGGPSGQVSIRILRPVETTGTLPVLLYTHGAGWVFGNAHTHDRLVRELTLKTIVVMVRGPSRAREDKITTRQDQQ